MSKFGKLSLKVLEDLSDGGKVKWFDQLCKLWSGNAEELEALLDRLSVNDIESCLSVNLERLVDFVSTYNRDWVNSDINAYVDNLKNILDSVNPLRKDPYFDTRIDSFSTNFPFSGNKVEGLFYIFLLQCELTPHLNKLKYDFSIFAVPSDH